MTYTVRLKEVDPYHNDVVDVGDEEKIINVSERSPARLIFHILTPVCGYDGCSRKVDSVEDVCWQHEEDA
jgi:hypothetical protein